MSPLGLIPTAPVNVGLKSIVVNMPWRRRSRYPWLFPSLPPYRPTMSPVGPMSLDSVKLAPGTSIVVKVGSAAAACPGKIPSRLADKPADLLRAGAVGECSCSHARARLIRTTPANPSVERPVVMGTSFEHCSTYSLGRGTEANLRARVYGPVKNGSNGV